MILALSAIVAAACIMPLVIVIAAQKYSSLRRRVEIDPGLRERLVELAKRSLDSMDVPVGSLLLYDGAVIGEGYNTVLREKSAGGHAEINAITCALGMMGYEKFSSLDRRKLVLVTTFEPCLMCAGACVNYNIRSVYYMQPKNPSELLAERKSYAAYLFRRLRLQNRGEQLELFRLHPDYPGRPFR
jgi:tRNA(Arg) A34 adenosine deaminase TadA